MSRKDKAVAKDDAETKSAVQVNAESGQIIDQSVPDQSKLNITANAIKLAGVFGNTDATRREAVMQMADEMAFKEEADLDEFFTAFKRELVEKGVTSGKVTASKIRGIWKAYTVPSFEYTVGLAEDKKTPVKDTHSGKEWLTTYLPKDKRGFEAFASFAVEIKGKDANSGGGGRSRVKLSDKDMESLEDRIKIANKDQAEEIVARGLDAVLAHSGQQALPVIIDQISVLVTRLETQKIDVSFQHLGANLRAQLNDWENQRETIKTSQILANAGMKDNSPAAPMPLAKAA